MTRRSNAGFFERLRGPRSTSYRGELQRRRHEAKLEAARRREAEREEIRRERQKVQDANKLKRQLLAEERREEQKRRKEEEREAPHKAMPSASAIERAYQRGAKTLSEAMEMARGNPGGPYTVKVRDHYEDAATLAQARERAKTLADTYGYIGFVYKGSRLVDSFRPSKRNPRGTKGRFERCVKAVSERGGAYDPEAVCAAQERREIGQKELTRRALAGKRAKARKQKNRVYTEGQYTADKDQAELAAQYLKERGYTGVRIRKRKGPLSGGYFGPNQTVYYITHHGQLTASGKRNPADAAIAVSEEFHGRKVKAMIPVQEKRHYHKYLAELGELRKLVVLCRDGKHRVTLSKFDGAMLCANEDKNQLFIVGGDQSVNLQDFGIKNPHETETLGEVITIDYFTDKEHLGDEGGVAVYTHKFRSTNDNGKHKTVRMAEYPDLIYHLRDEHLEFSGGSYEIRAEGIDL